MHSISRLSQTILEAYPQRFTLSPSELASMSTLAESMIPIEKQLQWVKELVQAKKKPSVSQLLRQLENKQQQWHQKHIGSGYTDEMHISKHVVQQAFAQLIKQVHLQTFEHNDAAMLDIFRWLEKRLQECAYLCQQYNDMDAIQLLRQLDQTLCDKVFCEAPRAIIERIEKHMLDLLKPENIRTRPQDLLHSQRQVMWSLLRTELNIPLLYLNLYGSW